MKKTFLFIGLAFLMASSSQFVEAATYQLNKSNIGDIEVATQWIPFEATAGYLKRDDVKDICPEDWLMKQTNELRLNTVSVQVNGAEKLTAQYCSRGADDSGQSFLNKLVYAMTPATRSQCAKKQLPDGTIIYGSQLTNYIVTTVTDSKNFVEAFTLAFDIGVCL